MDAIEVLPFAVEGSLARGTLGRAEEREGAGAFRSLDDLMSELECNGDVKVTSVDLMESKLAPGGSKYTLIASAQLG